jgi:hypothetical protein
VAHIHCLPYRRWLFDTRCRLEGPRSASFPEHFAN